MRSAADDMQTMYMPADNVHACGQYADDVQMTYVIRQLKSPTKSHSRVVCTSSAARFQPQNISSQRAENSSAKNSMFVSSLEFYEYPTRFIILCSNSLSEDLIWMQQLYFLIFSWCLNRWAWKFRWYRAR